MYCLFNIFTRVVIVDSPLLIKSGYELARVKIVDENEEPIVLGVGQSITFIFQPKNQFDSATIAGVTLTSSDLDATSGEYRKYYSLTTAGVLALLYSNSDVSDDVDDAVMQCTIVFDDATHQLPSQTFDVVLQNSAYAGTLSVPSTISPALNPGYWTSINGGTTTSLNSIITAASAWPINNIVFTVIGGNFQVWQLQANTGGVASDGVNYQRPLDYNAATNKVIWVKIA